MRRLASIVHNSEHALPLLLQGAGLQDGVQCVFLNGTTQPLQRLSYNVTVLHSGEFSLRLRSPDFGRALCSARDDMRQECGRGTCIADTPHRGVRSLCAQPVQVRRHARRRVGR